MFWLNKRVEEDLKRIKSANVPDMTADMRDTEAAMPAPKPESEQITPKDIFAICLAIFSLIGPFLIAILIISTLVLLWFFR